MRGQAIAAADANRQFSDVLRKVRNGATFTVTSHGRPVARIVPISATEHLTTKGKLALLKRLRGGAVVDAGRWTRDELYE
jgi:prevent-host-death family protein